AKVIIFAWLGSAPTVFLLIAGLVALALAAPRPAGEEKDAQVLKYDNDHNGIDGYNFQFDTSNGIQRQEQAQLKQFDDENAALVVRGSYSFTADDGQVYTVNYVADENGFQPEAPHLPK
uniref:Flexible cuticle protein 12 n=1 Tax=Anopheles atroparvus TaxID=41427 RepID=A0AAG5DDZ3_ANOAO